MIESGTFEFQECVSHNLNFQWIMIGLFGLLNLLIISYGCYLAFRTRKVSSAFNESKYIALCIYNITILGVMLLPIVFIEEAGYLTAYYLRGFGTIFCCFFILFTLFGPKVYFILFMKKKNTAEYFSTFKYGDGPKKLPSDPTTKNPAAEMTEFQQDEQIFMQSLMTKDQSEKLLGFFFREKWRKRDAFVLPRQKWFGWLHLDGDNAQSVLIPLKGTAVSAYSKNGEYQIELINSADRSYILKFENKGDFDSW